VIVGEQTIWQIHEFLKEIVEKSIQTNEGMDDREAESLALPVKEGFL
jgi:hypothetical protein